VAAVALLLFLVLPPAPRHVNRSAASDPLVVKGAIHVHTIRSDGGGTVDDVAAAASAAGLAFVIVTDHGDGRRIEPPSYRSGVLVLDGAEVSTAQGHVLAIGVRAAEYPLGGEARDVIEDIHRLGGFAVAAHPASAKREPARAGMPTTAWNG
jgi:predicted metal-dependent phosphoesterase TrpH